MVEILGCICEYLAKGIVGEGECGRAQQQREVPSDFEGLVRMLPDFTTGDERKFVETEKQVGVLHQDADAWLPLSARIFEGADFLLVNRKPLGKGLSRLVSRSKAVNGPNLSNKTTTCPGPNRKPHLSTTGTTVAFSSSVCREFVSGVPP